MNIYEVELDADLFDDTYWDDLADNAELVEKRRVYDELTSLLDSIDLQVQERKAKFAEAKATMMDGSPSLLRAEAHYLKWRASISAVRRATLMRRKDLNDAMRDSPGMRIDGVNWRTVITELAGAVLLAEQGIAHSYDLALYAKLDELKVHSGGKVYTLREFMAPESEGGAGGRWR